MAMDYQIHHLPVFDAPIEAFLDGVRGQQSQEITPLLRDIRALIPVEGDDWVKAITVAIKPGQQDHQGQTMHSHDEWTAVYYHEPAGVPLRIPTEEIYPEPGNVVVMPPGSIHGVAPNDSDMLRVSLAMLVEVPGAVSKFR